MLWVSQLAYPEWESSFVFGLLMYLVSSVTYKRNQDDPGDFNKLMSLTACIYSQLFAYRWLAWLMILFGFLSFFGPSVSIEHYQVPVSFGTFFLGLLFYSATIECSSITGYILISVIMITSWALCWLRMLQPVSKILTILSTVVTIQAVQNSIETVCMQEMEN